MSGCSYMTHPLLTLGPSHGIGLCIYLNCWTSIASTMQAQTVC